MYTAIQEMRDGHGERLILHSPNIVNLCIDFYDEEEQRGRLYHQYTEQTVLFSTLFEALEQMERLYDEIQFPQASTSLRSFVDEEESGTECDEVFAMLRRTMPREKQPERKKLTENGRRFGSYADGAVETFDRVIGHRGEDATFIIRVQYRQYSSWQGEVTWMDGRRRLPFRSVLELARLIDNAMHASGKEGQGTRGQNGVGKEAVSVVNADGK